VVLNGAHGPGAVGRRARTLCEAGHRPLCVVSRDRNVVRYLTIGHWDEMRIHEFHRRPFQLRKVEHEIAQADVILIDDGPALEPFVRLLQDDGRFRAAPPRPLLHEFQRGP
jgi:hypothetical protein